MVDACRLFLIAPPLDDPASLPALDRALASGLVDCVLLRKSATLGRDVLAAAVRAVQGRGAAALIDGEGREAARVGADGVHLAANDPGLAEALVALKPDGIVGAGMIGSRDLAMTVGESAVDYLMFGEPRPDGFVPALLNTLDQTRWWAELFTVPCVAYAETLDAVSPLVDAGAEFVALGEALWRDPRGPDVVLAALAGTLSRRAFA